MKTVQWNIGGGYSHTPQGEVPGLDEIIDTLRSLKPDIITLQEIHIGPNYNQAEIIAAALGNAHYVSDVLSPSYIGKDKDMSLGQAIISRFPITNHVFKSFTNPRLEKTWPNGHTEQSHDKGVTSCTLDLKHTELTVKSLHLIPLHRYEITLDSVKGQSVLDDFQAAVATPESRTLIQGDFNIDVVSLKKILPKLFLAQANEVSQKVATSIYGKKIDHIMFTKDIGLVHSLVMTDVKTDHYPIVCEFKI